MESDGNTDQPALRMGFRLIKGLSEAIAERLTAARREAPFRSMADVARRGRVSKALLARLSAADAFGSLGLDAGRRYGRHCGGRGFAVVRRIGRRGKRGTELAPVVSRNNDADYQATGLSLKAHPLSLIRADLDQLKVVSAAALAEMPDKAAVRVAGLVLVRQRPATANGTVFMSLEDETGLMNVIIWRRTWERFRKVAKDAVALLYRRQSRTGRTASSTFARRTLMTFRTPCKALRHARAIFVERPARRHRIYSFDLREIILDNED